MSVAADPFCPAAKRESTVEDDAFIMDDALWLELMYTRERAV